MAEPVIDTDLQILPAEMWAGVRGTIPRDYGVMPMRAVTMPLVPRSEWSARIKEQEASRSRLSDVRATGNAGQFITSLDQGSYGYCWAHSVTHAAMIERAVNNQPYEALSAFGVAATIKRGANEGAWGALALDFAADKGIPSQAIWPQGNANYRQYDRPETWTDAARHRIGEAWNDVAVPAYDRELSFDQVATCLLTGVPVIGDYNWWAHSICLLDLVETSPGQFGVRIWNSWGDSWGEKGQGVLTGSKAIPDGATAVRVVSAAS